MCGIAGQVTADRRPVEEWMIAAMGERLRLWLDRCQPERVPP